MTIYGFIEVTEETSKTLVNLSNVSYFVHVVSGGTLIQFIDDAVCMKVNESYEKICTLVSQNVMLR